MIFEVNNYNIFLIIGITFLLSMLLTPLVRQIAIHIGALDYPNERKVHKEPMPRLGGLAIYLAFIIGYAFFGQVNTQMLSILIGGFVIILTGLIDDIHPIRARYKLLAQIFAVLFVVIYGQIYFTEISFLGIHFYVNKYVSYILSSIFIVAITNAINLIDGLDGLATGVSSIYFTTIAIIALILNRSTGLDIVLSVIMLGATLGFLPYNFPPAKIFMGDTGSLFLGYMISVIALLGFKITTITSLVVPICILAIPIIDTILAIFRRLLKHESIGKADKEHLHHQLLRMTSSTTKTVLIIYFINMIFSAISILYVVGDNKLAIFLYVLVMVLFLALVLKTNILFEHNSPKGKATKNE